MPGQLELAQERQRAMRRITRTAAVFFRAAQVVTLGTILYSANGGFAHAQLESASTPADKASDSAGVPVAEVGHETDSSRERTERTERALESMICADFIETDIQDVLEGLKKRLQIPIVVDHAALEVADIQLTGPVTLSVQEMRASVVLDYLTSQMDVAFLVRDGILIVTTREKLEANATTRVYHCGDLLETIPVEFTIRTSEAAVLANATLPVVSKPLTPCEAMEYMIEQTIDSDSWQNNGGPGTIVALRHGELVVTQNYNVHRKIEKFLKDLRQALREGPGSAAGKD